MQLTPGKIVEGWTVLEPMDGASHVAWARHFDGRKAVLKTRRYKNAVAKQRFAQEARWMRRLQGTPGVLALLDADPSPTPEWFVVESAQTITEYLGPTPDLHEVVRLFHELADTFVTLKGRGIAHRDIKPPNLFVVNGTALVGDLGIAAFPHRPGLTQTGERVGPMHFQAPETRQAHPGLDAYAADVYSFASSLWASAAGETYPPPGVLTASREAASLYSAGASAALQLARLLEICTEDAPHHRPTMQTVMDELGAWLDLHPAGSVLRPQRGHPNIRPGAWHTHVQALAGAYWDMAGRCVSRLRTQATEALEHLGPRADLDGREGPSLLADYNPEAVDWEPDWTVDPQEIAWEGLADRLVVGAYGDGDDVTYVFEWHQETQDGFALRHVDTNSARLHLPSDHLARDKVVRLIVASAPAPQADPG